VSSGHPLASDVSLSCLKKRAIFEVNWLNNKVKVTRADKPETVISKTPEVVQLYDST
jgi:hypothetical protein